jgi:glycogen operon protein
MFVSGDPLRSPGRHGEQEQDSSFLLWFNADPEPVEVVMPVNDWVTTGSIVISTDPALAAGTPVRAGDVLTLDGRSVLVLRQD